MCTPTYASRNKGIKMNNEIISVFKLNIERENLPAFKKLVEKIVNKTKEEAGTLTYVYSIDEKQNSIHIVERYMENSLLSHIDVTFAPFAEEFLQLATVTELTVYGNPNAIEQERLNKFGAIYLTPFDGFSK
jgi:quinol monooxygenase YgiN